MTYFPLFCDLAGRDILIFGSDSHAKDKIERLLPFEPRITVTDESIPEDIKNIEGIVTVEGPLDTSLLDSHPFLVITTLCEERTALIYEECQKRHIPVNAVDMPRWCDVIFPSVIAKEHLCIGISSGGISPTAAVEFKSRIERLIPDETDEILQWMPIAKARLKQRCEGAVLRAALRKALCLALERGEPLTDGELDALL